MTDGTGGKVRVIGREVKTEPRAMSTQQQTRRLATELVLRKRDRVKQQGATSAQPRCP